MGTIVPGGIIKLNQLLCSGYACFFNAVVRFSWSGQLLLERAASPGAGRFSWSMWAGGAGCFSWSGPLLLEYVGRRSGPLLLERAASPGVCGQEERAASPGAGKHKGDRCP